MGKAIKKDQVKPNSPANRWMIWVIVITGFLFYINTLNNQYALDDSIVITQNQLTRQGLQGIPKILTTDSFYGFFGQQKDLVAGGRYRPLSLITFAMEYEFFGLKPAFSHFINMLLYCLTLWMLFKILNRLFKTSDNQHWIRHIPFLAVMLFAVHPVHTEVVANIKGRDEILSLAGALAAFWYLLNDYEKPSAIHKLLAGLFLFLGMMSKENAIVFLLLIPLALWYLKGAPFRKAFQAFLLLAVPSVLFLWIRQSVLGSFSASPPQELMNNPFAHATEMQKFATIFLTFAWYVRLLFIPWPLTYDYYPYHVPLVNWTHWMAISGLLIVILLLVITWIFWYKKHPAGYFLLFAMVAFLPMSNLVFPVGTFMNERFLYAPSIGFCVIVMWLVAEKILPQPRHEGWKGGKKFWVSMLFITWGALTFSRNYTWKNDFTLFTTDVKTSVNSAKGNCTAGGNLWEAAVKLNDAKKRDSLLRMSLFYLDRAVKIYPQYNDALLLRGNAIWEIKHDFDAASEQYFNILSRSPQHQHASQNLMIITSKIQDYDKRLATYRKITEINPKNDEAFYQAGVILARNKNDFAKATLMFETALKIKPSRVEIYKDLGVAYGFMKQYGLSRDALLKAYEMDKNDPQTCYNLALTYMALNQKSEAELFMQKFREMEAIKQNGKNK